MQTNPIIRAVDKVGGAEKMAQALGVSVQSVYFWRTGKRGIPIEHGARIEEVTGGEVTRQQLWPNDWHRIWPELLCGNCEHKQHPALASQAFAAINKQAA